MAGTTNLLEDGRDHGMALFLWRQVGEEFCGRVHVVLGIDNPIVQRHDALFEPSGPLARRIHVVFILFQNENHLLRQRSHMGPGNRFRSQWGDETLVKLSGACACACVCPCARARAFHLPGMRQRTDGERGARARPFHLPGMRQETDGERELNRRSVRRWQKGTLGLGIAIGTAVTIDIATVAVAGKLCLYERGQVRNLLGLSDAMARCRENSWTLRATRRIWRGVFSVLVLALALVLAILRVRVRVHVRIRGGGPFRGRRNRVAWMRLVLRHRGRRAAPYAFLISFAIHMAVINT